MREGENINKGRKTLQSESKISPMDAVILCMFKAA